MGQQLQEQLGHLGQLGQLGQLGGLISTFLGPAAVEAAFPLLEALTKAGQDHLAKAGQDGQEQPRKGENQAMEEQVPAQEKEAEEKEKKYFEPEKEKEMETQDDTKDDSDFEVSRKCLKRRASTPRSHPRSRLACGKPTQDSLRKRKGKRPLRRWTRTHTLVLRT